MGTSQDYRVAAEEGATLRPRRLGPVTADVTFRAEMGFADLWNRTLVYFGIAEEEDWDEDGYVTDEELERTYARAAERAPAGAAPARARSSTTGPSPASRRPPHAAHRPALRPRVARGARGRAEPGASGAPRPPAQLQRRPADRGQVQGRRSR